MKTNRNGYLNRTYYDNDNIRCFACLSEYLDTIQNAVASEDHRNIKY